MSRRGLLGVVALVAALRLAGVELDAGDGVQVAFVQWIIVGIAEAARWLADKAVTIAVVVWHATKIVAFALWRFATALGGVLGKVYGLLRDFWSGVLKPFIKWVDGRILKLEKWLRDTFGPTLKWLETQRRRLLEFYDRWFRPIFDTIEVVRRTLQLLATFRLEWAQELDRKLAELEDRLLWPIREAMFRLNQIADWLNRVIGLDGLFQRLTLIRSLLEYERDGWKIWWTSIGRREKEKPKVAPGQPSARTLDDVARDLTAYVRHNEGPDAPRVDEHAADLGLRLRRVRSSAL